LVDESVFGHQDVQGVIVAQNRVYFSGEGWGGRGNGRLWIVNIDKLNMITLQI
jgi:hypothetical protein